MESLAPPVELARHVDRLGFTRFWLAEHHNMPGIASSAPTVLMAAVAAVDRADPGRVGRRHAAQPPAARRRRAVRHAGGALPRPHRPRAGTRAGHRPDDGPGAAPQRRRAVRRRLPAPARRADRLPARHLPRRAPVPAIRAVPGVGDGPPVWLLGLQRVQRAAGRAARSAVRVRPPLHGAEHAAGARSCTGTRSRRPSCSRSRTRWWPCRSSRPRPTRRRTGWRAPGVLSFLRLRRDNPVALPTVGGRGGVPVDRRGARVRRRPARRTGGGQRRDGARAARASCSPRPAQTS